MDVNEMMLLNWLIYLFPSQIIHFIETNMGLRDFHINLKVCPLFINKNNLSHFSHFLISIGDSHKHLDSQTLITSEHDPDVSTTKMFSLYNIKGNRTI